MGKFSTSECILLNMIRFIIFLKYRFAKKEEKDSPIGSCGIRKIRTNRVDTHMIVCMPQKKVRGPPRDSA
jgi:hypothetical protein